MPELHPGYLQLHGIRGGGKRSYLTKGYLTATAIKEEASNLSTRTPKTNYWHIGQFQDIIGKYNQIKSCMVLCIRKYIINSVMCDFVTFLPDLH